MEAVYFNGKIWTEDAAQPEAAAMVVSAEGKLTFVGSTEDALARASAGAVRVDLEGKRVLPGLVESHVHPLMGAGVTSGLLFGESDALPELQRKIAEYAAANPEGTLFGQNWGTAVFPPEGPNKGMIDAVVADRPVCLVSWDMHALWCNSKALEVAGITKETVNPEGGFYHRDAEGNPNGYVGELSAMVPIVLACNAITPEKIASSLERMLYGLSMQGFTTAHDAGSGFCMGPALAAARAMDAAGKLPLRLEACYMGMPTDSPAEVVAGMQAVHGKYGSPDVDGHAHHRKHKPHAHVVEALGGAGASEVAGHGHAHGDKSGVRSSKVSVRFLKLVSDGSMEHHSAQLEEPYTDMPDTRGGDRYSDAQLADTVIATCAAGFDIMIHAIGDRAIRQTLSAFEAARAAGHKSNRLCITHADLMRPEQAARVAPLDVTIQSTGLWMAPNPALRPILGIERYNSRYMYQRPIAEGVNFALGSDWPATFGGWKGTCPWSNIEAAVTRRVPANFKATMAAIGSPEELEETAEPVAERLTVQQAVRASTLGGAKQLGWDKWTGSLTAGKAADFVVVSQDLFAVEPSDIHKTEAVLTVCGGKVTHNTFKSDGSMDALALGSAEALAAASAASASCDSPHRREPGTPRKCC